MAIDWDGYLVKIVDLGSDSYEKRVHRQILFAIVGVAGLIVLWKVLA